MAIWCRGDRMMAVLIVARKANVVVDRGAVSEPCRCGRMRLHSNRATRPGRRACGLFRRPGFAPGGWLVTGGVLRAAVEIGGVLARRKPFEEPAFGVRGQLLDHIGYCVTVMAGEACELGLGLNADEELDALLGAVDAEMALAIALLLLGRCQSHDRLSGYGVTDGRELVTP